ncbi:MAG: AI-2E family transporter [Limnobacter sp.]|nr:AI-2E family transporter [Limnobacter sp.]
MNLSILLKHLYREHWALILSLFFVLFALGYLWSVISPFLAAALISYLVSSPANWVVKKSKYKIKYPIAAVITVLFFMLVAGSIGLLLIPVVLSQIDLIRTNLPTVLAGVVENVVPFLNQQFGLRLPLNPVRLKNMAQGLIFNNGEDVFIVIRNVLTAGSGSLLGFTGFITLVATATLFMAPGWPKMVTTIYTIIPPRVLTRLIPLGDDLNRTLSHYLRGMGVVVTFQGVFYAVALSAIGLNAGWAIGLLAGVLSLVPYIGLTISAVIAIFSAILDFQGVSGVLMVVAIFGIGQIIEGFILTPVVVGDKIGLSALSVVFSLTFFGALFGLVGVILALPLAACLKVILDQQIEAYRRSEFFNSTGVDSAHPDLVIADSVQPDAIRQDHIRQDLSRED